MNAPVYVCVMGFIIVFDALDNASGFLGGCCVIKINEPLAVYLSVENREVSLNFFSV